MKIKHPVFNWAVAVTATVILKALFLTVRVRHLRASENGTPYIRPTTNERFCFCLWHDAIVTAIFGLKSYRLAGLMSRHQDGSYAAIAARLNGIAQFRGSSSRGGAQATRQLLEQSDMHVCITPDGPRGPRRVMKDGIVYMSSRTGRPIVPTTAIATRFWSVPASWSDMLIPKPFSTLYLIAGTPLMVPAEASREQISEITDTVQKEMDRLDLIGQRIVSGDQKAIELIRTPGTYPNDAILPPTTQSPQTSEPRRAA
ncbi:MAG: lysophospholipid acyltransferase family protein [Planctomycetaceae bacterium]|nr:lysophospholipid acyltransferase family protein [Planctomycetaceae bacterium]